MGQLGGAELRLDPRAGLAGHGEAVVLRGDGDAAGGEVLDRVVGAAVPERELEGLQAGRAREQLVAEADSEHRLADEQRADRVDDVVERRRVARPGHEEEPVGVAGQQLVGRRRAGVELELNATLYEVANDRALDARVERDDAKPTAFSLDAGFVHGHLAREVTADHRRLGERRAPSASPTGNEAGKIPPRIAPSARMCRTSARVSTPGDPRDALRGQPVEPALLGARRVDGVDRLAHDRPRRVHPVGLPGLAATRRSCRRAPS